MKWFCSFSTIVVSQAHWTILSHLLSVKVVFLFQSSLVITLVKLNYRKSLELNKNSSEFYQGLYGIVLYQFYFYPIIQKNQIKPPPPLPFLLCIRLNAYQLILVCCNRCKLCFWKYKAPELFALNIGDRGTFSVLPSYKVDPGLKLMHGVQDNLEQKITIKNES